MNGSAQSLHALPLGAVKPRGWLLKQLQRDLATGFAARLDQLTPHAAHDLFRERIGSSDDFKAWWDAETRGNWLWGYLMTAALAEMPEHRERIDALMKGLLATQDEDGYIGIYAPGERYRHAEGENGELWAQSRALLALIAWYEITCDGQVLDAITRAVDLTLDNYPPGRPFFTRGGNVGRDVITGLTHGLCYIDVLEWIYAKTLERKYAAAAVRLYREFSSMPTPFPNDDLALPNLLEEKHVFGGHAVHTAEHLRALLFVHSVAPDVVTDEVVRTALQRFVTNRLPSGALLGDENIHGMPLPDAPYEFCTLTELAFSLSSALQKLSNANHGDWLERLVFNAVQGARAVDGSGIAYLSADTRLFATADRPDAHSQGAAGRRFKYSPTHDDVACCCNPNAARVLPQFISRMWLRLDQDAGFAAVAYGPCEMAAHIGDVAVSITQQTSYPFSDQVEIIINPETPVHFTLLLRKPQWRGAVSVTAAGAAVGEQDGWYRIEKQWQKGERVRIAFTWQPYAERYGNGEVAVLRGPLQYALPLSHRLEPLRDYPGTDLHDYNVIPSDIVQGYRVPLVHENEADLGLRFESRPLPDESRPWDQTAYRLRTGDISIIPIGCTLLRRAGFPSVRK